MQCTYPDEVEPTLQIQEGNAQDGGQQIEVTKITCSLDHDLQLEKQQTCHKSEPPSEERQKGEWDLCEEHECESTDVHHVWREMPDPAQWGTHGHADEEMLDVCDVVSTRVEELQLQVTDIERGKER